MIPVLSCVHYFRSTFLSTLWSTFAPLLWQAIFAFWMVVLAAVTAWEVTPAALCPPAPCAGIYRHTYRHATDAYWQVKLPLASIEQQARQKLAELAGVFVVPE